MTTDLIKTKAQIIGNLLPLKLARDAKNAATADDKRLTDETKQWMQLEGVDELYDGEHDINVTLKASSTTTWDIRKAPPELVARLAAEGLLTVNTTAFKAEQAKGGATYLDDTLAFKHEGETWTLRIEKKQ